MPDGPGGGVIARERVAPAKLRAGHARPLPGVVGVGVPDDPLPVYHSAKLTPSNTAFTSTSLS